MKRFHSCPTYLAAELEANRESDSANQTLGTTDSTPFCLFAPHHFEPNYRYPLLVWLHGSDDDERQLHRVMPHITLRNYVAVGPRGTTPASGGCGCCWKQTAASIADAETRVLATIEAACRKYNVAGDQIYLAGFQDGGTMALRLGMLHPNRFAGAISIGGPFPELLAPLSRLAEIRQLPLLICQSRESQSYSAHTICNELRLFHAAGLQVMLRQYPCGDELTTQMLHDLNAWIMERVTGESMTTDADLSVFPASGIN
jgi:phospholipase/carboxylesterase